MNNEYDLNTLVEVQLEKDNSFLLVKETLTRIGVSSKHRKTLFQSCHILHKRGKFYIVHFKELFGLDGKPFNFDATDIKRRNTIVRLLSEWGLVSVVKPEQIADQAPMSQVKIIPYSQKSEWELVPKYTLGKYKAKDKSGFPSASDADFDYNWNI
jgi:hypothetical protein